MIKLKLPFKKEKELPEEFLALDLGGGGFLRRSFFPPKANPPLAKRVNLTRSAFLGREKSLAERTRQRLLRK